MHSGCSSARRPALTQRSRPADARNALAEPLEQRVLLAAAPAGKAAALGKLGSALNSTYTEYTRHVARNAQPGAVRQAFKPRESLLHLSGERVSVQMTATGDGKQLETDLRKLGSTYVRRQGRRLSALVPLSAINRLASLKSLSVARPVWAITHADPVTSLGDPAMRADIARATYGVNGSGVKVGILSDSFNTSSTSIKYANDIASGDLPAGVQILQDFPNGSDEGRAMAQLVYDTAPGVSFAFASAYYGQAQFAANIRALRDTGAKVIVDDVSYLDEPMFQDGVVAQAVDDVQGSGVAYFSAAGNAGRQGYDSAFRTGNVRAANTIAASSSGITFGGGTTHDFNADPSVIDDMQSLTLAPGASIFLTLQWDQPYSTAGGFGSGAGSSSDLDVYLLNSNGTQIVAGSIDDNVTHDPVEVFSYTNASSGTVTYNLMIANWGVDPSVPTGPNPGKIKYIDYGTANFTQLATRSGTIMGHANANGAIAVGAAAYFLTPSQGVSPPVAESFSAAGGTPILFDKNGTRLAQALSRPGPALVAPDGGNNTFLGFPLNDGDSYPNFFGTSAAAPAAGAVAALMLSGRPTLTPAQILGAMTSTAIDMDDPSTGGFDTGVDSLTGAGLLNAQAAMSSLFPAFDDSAVNGGAAQRSQVTSMNVSFDRPVTATAGAFTILRRGDNSVVNVSASSSNGIDWTLQFSGPLVSGGGSVEDGIYDLTVNASLIHDASGQAMAANIKRAFHRLFSDGDGDGDTDALDLFQLRSTYLKHTGDTGYLSYFDYENDGDVDALDLFQVRSRRATTYKGY